MNIFRHVYRSLHGTTEGQSIRVVDKNGCQEDTAPPSAISDQIAGLLNSGEPVSATEADLIVIGNGDSHPEDSIPNGASRAGTETSNAGSRAGTGTSNGAGRAGTGSPEDVRRAGKTKDRSGRVNLLGLALAQYPEYSLVVTGHSLGAGTATILAFLLRCFIHT